jgi:tetratricopeptide (TPR) repeat protein
MSNEDVGASQRLAEATALYERSVFEDDASGLGEADRLLDGVEAELSVARGKILHGRFLDQRRAAEAGAPAAVADPRELELFEHALELYRRLGDQLGEAEALFQAGCYHQVVLGDSEAAVPLLEQAAALAGRSGAKLTESYALRHLGFADHQAGRLDLARERMAASAQLRRDVGFLPGVAANLVGLAYISAQQGNLSSALAFADEALTVADHCGAVGMARLAVEARASIDAAGAE